MRSHTTARAAAVTVAAAVALAAPAAAVAAEPPGPAPAPTAEATPRASGLAFDSGVFAHSLDRVERYEKATGRKVDVLSVSPARGSWATIMDPWWLKAPAGFKGTLDVAVPLWQEDGDLATAAAGGYDAEWTKLGQMIEEKFPGSSVRAGWEMNIPGWKHAATPANVGQWRQAYQHSTVALKKGGPSLKTVFNPNKSPGGSLPDAAQAYPGDAYVDYIGLDAYDWWPKYTPESVNEHFNGPQGWNYWLDFAKAHGKKFAVPEWGVAPGNAQGGGDNPYFIEQVWAWLIKNQDHVAFVNYFDEPEGYIANSVGDGQVPKTAAALKAAMVKAEKKGAVTNPPPAVPAPANQVGDEPAPQGEATPAADAAPSPAPAPPAAGEGQGFWAWLFRAPEPVTAPTAAPAAPPAPNTDPAAPTPTGPAAAPTQAPTVGQQPQAAAPAAPLFGWFTQQQPAPAPAVVEPAPKEKAEPAPAVKDTAAPAAASRFGGAWDAPADTSHGPVPTGP